ncbi:hypothetical protein P885DRAFT_71936 [Corynascus similis CBS 632.67]
MKVIVAGSNGLVGSALVRQCMANDSISHAVAKSPKVTVILHDDFSTYPQELLDRVKGCLWWVLVLLWKVAIGGRATQFPDIDTYRKVQVDYTITAAIAFRETLVPLLPEGSHFRFVFCSGKLAEWDQTKTLHFMADTRHIKGQVEQRLCQVADVDAAERFAVYCTRPSGILPANAGLAARALGKLYGAIDVD